MLTSIMPFSTSSPWHGAKCSDTSSRCLTDLATGLPLIEGYRVQLQQVVRNLILNAVEAMSSLDEGARELRISTTAAASNGVLVAVRDNRSRP